MQRLVAIEARGTRFTEALRAAWDAGDAVLPVDPRLPGAAAAALVESLHVGDPIDRGVALVVPTSGTTGDPKGVQLTHEQVGASAEATSSFLGVDPARHRWLACLPLAHVGGLSVVTRAWHTGTPLEVHDGFDAAAVDAAARSGCTHVSLVGTALARIDASAWIRIVLGGAAPPPDRPSNTVATYGMTETGSGVVYDGVALPGVELRIDDGEILVRGPMVATSYRDGTPVVDDAGWLHTGDLGRLDDGILTVHGRRGDMIITGGENVHPDPVERRLRQHPAVADAAVVGRPDPEWGQRVVAVLELAPGADAPDLDEVRGWVRETLPPWSAPKQLEVVDALPRTSLGKVRRSAVR
ncbi:AMP-binding protein [Acidimicrobiia bacterium EGI L10123]|uniref:class I adenylate-forming enzyme family protein n=1 Tax=Salinilacustrithrix flava TaxID=2957203 RepID=UPI003D7C2206|nr:AMP-binding protein [Acidimicrobiia bacterium EGI L10123]